MERPLAKNSVMVRPFCLVSDHFAETIPNRKFNRLETEYGLNTKPR